ncbi:MAG: hypothetical protein FVQ77_14170 [Cytophagales bacterium]|nr:hypothetical protein [Cytophagales bacterium]
MLSEKKDFLINWFKDLEQDDLLLSYKGDFDQRLVTPMWSYIEEKLDIEAHNLFLKSRLLSVIVECLQNICNHGEKIDNSKMTQGIFMIGKNQNEFITATGNFILNHYVASLKKLLDNINDMGKEGVKKRFKEVLKESKSSDHGGGLGFLDIARKSERKFEYHFHPVDKKYSFFSFQVKITIR